jgi:hypothetical protein
LTRSRIARRSRCHHFGGCSNASTLGKASPICSTVAPDTLGEPRMTRADGTSRLVSVARRGCYARGGGPQGLRTRCWRSLCNAEPVSATFARGSGHLLFRLTSPSENHHRAGHSGHLRGATLADMGGYRMKFVLRESFGVPRGERRFCSREAAFPALGHQRWPTVTVLGQAHLLTRS